MDEVHRFGAPMIQVLLEGEAMTLGSYGLNEAWRAHVDADIARCANRFLAGEVGVIALARSLSGYHHEVAGSFPELAEDLAVFVGIASETDELPIGAVLDMWHPSTKEIEAEKVQHAEALYLDIARESCDSILRRLGT